MLLPHKENSINIDINQIYESLQARHRNIVRAFLDAPKKFPDMLSVEM